MVTDKESMLARMFSAEENGLSAGRKDANNSYLIDRSPKYFVSLANSACYRAHRVIRNQF